MLRTREENILCHLLRDKIIQNCESNISQEVKQLCPKKTNLSLSSQISSRRVNKQRQHVGRKSQIWQEVDCKMF